MRLMLQGLALVMLLFTMPALGQAPTKVKIYVECTCDDIVGAQYATALRDAIARSPRYELASSPSVGVGKSLIYWWSLSIVTLDDSNSPAEPGHKTAISIVLTFNAAMVSQHIQTCGVSAVDHCAAMTLSSTDNEIQKFLAH